jgi:hypothetical protein
MKIVNFGKIMSEHTVVALPVATVYSLDAPRERRYYIDLANSNSGFQSIKASFAISGMVLNDDNAEDAGRMIAGEMTIEQKILAIRKRYDIT